MRNDEKSTCGIYATQIFVQWNGSSCFIRLFLPFNPYITCVWFSFIANSFSMPFSDRVAGTVVHAIHWYICTQNVYTLYTYTHGRESRLQISPKKNISIWQAECRSKYSFTSKRIRCEPFSHPVAIHPAHESNLLQPHAEQDWKTTFPKQKTNNANQKRHFDSSKSGSQWRNGSECTVTREKSTDSGKTKDICCTADRAAGSGGGRKKNSLKTTTFSNFSFKPVTTANVWMSATSQTQKLKISSRATATNNGYITLNIYNNSLSSTGWNGKSVRVVHAVCHSLRRRSPCLFGFLFIDDVPLVLQCYQSLSSQFHPFSMPK